MTHYEGEASNVDFLQPTMMGKFILNNAFLFYLTDEAVPPKVFTVRFECVLRIPRFDGFKVEVDGDLDETNNVIRGRRLTITQTGTTIFAVRRFGDLRSLLTLTLLVAGAVFLWYFGTGLLKWAFLEQQFFIARLIFAVIVYIVWFITLVLALMYISRVVMPTLYEVFDLALRIISEYESEPASTRTKRSEPTTTRTKRKDK